MLRAYQSAVIEHLYQWFRDNQQGHPCIVLPTGSGKSHVVAALCKEALQQWPETRVLMLTHQKELIEQNAEKLRLHWPDAPLGIYSAGIGLREIDQITFASIQSVAKRGQQLGHRHLVIIDECHLISTNQTGQYRKLIAELTEINADLRVIGLTATPYRLTHGYIHTGKDALFSDLIEVPGTEVSTLISEGYLSPLKSKGTSNAYRTDTVRKRAGEFLEADLNEQFNTEEQTEGVVREIIERADNRRHWLLFCFGVAHAQAVADELNQQGIRAESINGQTPKAEREAIIARFKSGQTQALTNAMVLTTGFDFPGIDLIALLRPTASTGLYMQMVGRGLRLKEHTDHCLILDFGGNIKRHGPVTNPHAGSNSTKQEINWIECPECGEINDPKNRFCTDCNFELNPKPVKYCPLCSTENDPSALKCVSCGYKYPMKAPAEMELDDQSDIMGQSMLSMNCLSWRWAHYINANGNEVLKCTYYPDTLTGKQVYEFFTLSGNAWAVQKAVQNLAMLYLTATGQPLPQDCPPPVLAQALNTLPAPATVSYEMNGKFADIKERTW
jgi:DNA repair protein RadD